jgi:NTP pyrophosphatase (non-canonical NTP hydrolase)
MKYEVNNFAAKMLARLEEKAYRGVPGKLIEEHSYHMLRTALNLSDSVKFMKSKEEITKQAVDVANYCMFIINSFDGQQENNAFEEVWQRVERFRHLQPHNFPYPPWKITC